MKSDSNNELAVSRDMDDEAVSKFLLDNPDFFNRNTDLLETLTIPHGSGGAISLLERQIALFRGRNRELQNNINDFIFNAEENDTLFEKTRTIILELLKTTTLTKLSALVESTLNTEFSAHHSSLLFITDHDASDDNEIDNSIDSSFENEQINTLPATTAKEILGKLFNKKRTFCCELSSEQAKLLFPSSQKEILSAAIIPIHPGESVMDKALFNKPILMIGSDKHNHFNVNLDTLFLDFVGEIISVHIARLVG